VAHGLGRTQCCQPAVADMSLHPWEVEASRQSSCGVNIACDGCPYALDHGTMARCPLPPLLGAGHSDVLRPSRCCMPHRLPPALRKASGGKKTARCAVLDPYTPSTSLCFPVARPKSDLEASPLKTGRAEKRTSEEPMKLDRRFAVWTALVLGALLGLPACSYDAALRHLSPAEQAEFALYHHRMTGVQQHTYLGKASAAARTAYLHELGLV
jgi:hypothetical protein